MTASVRIAQAAMQLDWLDEPTKVDLQVSQVSTDS